MQPRRRLGEHEENDEEGRRSDCRAEERCHPPVSSEHADEGHQQPRHSLKEIVFSQLHLKNTKAQLSPIYEPWRSERKPILNISSLSVNVAHFSNSNSYCKKSKGILINKIFRNGLDHSYSTFPYKVKSPPNMRLIEFPLRAVRYEIDPIEECSEGHPLLGQQHLHHVSANDDKGTSDREADK